MQYAKRRFWSVDPALKTVRNWTEEVDGIRMSQASNAVSTQSEETINT